MSPIIGSCLPGSQTTLVDYHVSGDQRLALAMHHQQHSWSTPAKSTCSHGLPAASFNACSSFVERIKCDLHMPEIEKEKTWKKALEDNEQRIIMAVVFIDHTYRSALHNGARMVINFDELSAKVIEPPHTVLAPASIRRAPCIPSNRSEKEACAVIFVTTASEVKLKPAVVMSERGPWTMQAFAHLTPDVHCLMGTGGSMTTCGRATSSSS